MILDHVALIAHVADAYGGMKKGMNARRGGLAPHQERRVKELMAGSLREDIRCSVRPQYADSRLATLPGHSVNPQACRHIAGLCNFESSAHGNS